MAHMPKKGSDVFQALIDDRLINNMIKFEISKVIVLIKPGQGYANSFNKQHVLS